MSNPDNPNDPRQETTEPFDPATMDAAFEQDEAMEHSGDGHQQPVDDGQSPDDLKAAVEDANRRVLMAHAEMENLRKRMRRDYEDQLKYATMPLLKDLLPVLDNLQRAISAAGSNQAAAGLVEGVQMVVKQFEDTLQKHHCQPIPAEGELFDPNYHEAISQMPSEQYPEGVVAHQAVPGYQLHERVVRPSQVIVSTGSQANA